MRLRSKQVALTCMIIFLSLAFLLCCRFIPLIFVYFIAGMLYNKYHRGTNTFPEMIPNHSFWSDFPFLIKVRTARDPFHSKRSHGVKTILAGRQTTQWNLEKKGFYLFERRNLFVFLTALRRLPPSKCFCPMWLFSLLRVHFHTQLHSLCSCSHNFGQTL